MQKSKKDLMLHEWILGCSKEHKQFLLRQAIKEKNIGAYMKIADLLLNAPISEGGLASEDIPHPAQTLSDGE